MNAAGFKRLPENMRKKVIETYHLTEAEASILGDARNFGVDIDPSDWPKVGPFTEVHNFYSPARSNLGKIVFKSPKFSEDLLMFGNILMEAIASDLNSWTRELHPTLGVFRDVRDARLANIDLIREIDLIMKREGL